MVAAAFEIGIGVYEGFFTPAMDKLALIDGGAITFAILIVIALGAISDYKKQSQFRALNDFGKSLVSVKVLRNGEQQEMSIDKLLVGDIVSLATGVVIPADGILINGFSVAADESSMTGEPHAIEKDLKNDPFLLSGTNCVNGVGQMLVIGTGLNSLNGRTMLALEVEPEDTPLQQKLGHLADAIAKFAIFLAIFMVILLVIVYFVSNNNFSDGGKVGHDMIQIVILAVTVVVVAVPEGLPLAVTLSLAHATVQMLKDNNLVRHLGACETMGNATAICSDKTGTLTLNKMTVVESTILGAEYDAKDHKKFIADMTKESPEKMQDLVRLVTLSLNINSSAGEIKNKEGVVLFNGSKTEIALLEFTAKLGFPYASDRSTTKVLHVTPFSSDRKRMSCIAVIPYSSHLATLFGFGDVEENSFEIMFVKGASEIVLKACTKVLSPTGQLISMDAGLVDKYQRYISKYADEALRTICCAFKLVKPGQKTVDDKGELLDSENLVLVGLFGILDPLRPEVKEAVLKCQRAGVKVRMVTGDGTQTARAIARGCGILEEGDLVLEGPDFRKLTQAELDQTLPKLSVLARSSPLDKQILVNNLKRLGETVAVTGGRIF